MPAQFCSISEEDFFFILPQLVTAIIVTAVPDNPRFSCAYDTRVLATALQASNAANMLNGIRGSNNCFYNKLTFSSAAGPDPSLTDKNTCLQAVKATLIMP